MEHRSIYKMMKNLRALSPFLMFGMMVLLSGCPSSLLPSGNETEAYKPSTTSASAIPKVTTNGYVWASTNLPDGSFLLAGNFTAINPEPNPYLIRVSTDGTRDPALDVQSGFNGIVRAAALLSDGSYIIGGDFTTYRGRLVNYLCKLTPAGELDTTFSPVATPGANGAVLAIAVASDDSIYFGGSFTAYRGSTANYVAKVSSLGVLDTTFSPTPAANGANAAVRSVVISGTDIYIGGSFTLYRAATANYVAKLSTTGVLDLTFNPAGTGANSLVYALAVSGASLYVGGTFTTWRGSTANRIAKMDTTNATLDGTFNPGVGANGTGSTVFTIAISGSDIYLGGLFTTYRSAAANYIAKVDSSGVLDTTFSPASGTNGFSGSSTTVYSLGVLGSSVYAGGAFQTYRGQVACSIAKLSDTGILDTTFSPAGSNGTGGIVYAVTGTASQVLFGGDFYGYRGSLARGIAKIDPSGQLNSTFNPPAVTNGANHIVYSIAVYGSDIFLGGAFTEFRNASANYVTKVDLNGDVQPSFTPSDGQNGADGPVYVVRANSQNTYIGGSFTNYRGAAANRVARLDLFGNLSSSFNPVAGANGVSDIVTALEISSDGEYVYLGGDFTTYRGTTVNRIAKVSKLGVLDATFSGGGTVGFNESILTMLISNGSLYVGGDFSVYRGSNTAHAIAKLDPDSGALDTTFNPAATANGMYSGTVRTIIASGTDLYVGGDFSRYRGETANNVVRLDTNGEMNRRFSPAVGPNGADSYVYTILLKSDQLYLGGNFQYYRLALYRPFFAVVDSLGEILN